MAMKGFVDHRTGVMVASANLGLKNMPVRRYLCDRFGHPTWVDNDVHAATIGEIQYGAGTRYRDFLYVNVGTGIAVGLVFDGKLCRGTANLAGEFGHATVNLDGKSCHCGLRGCLEEVVSGPGIEAWYRSEAAGAGALRASEVLALGATTDGPARRVLESVVEYLGVGIVNLVNILNPEAVIFGGGVFSGTDDFVARLGAFVRSRALRESVACLDRVAVSSLEPEHAGVRGAAGLVWEGIGTSTARVGE
jgi:predicted NBD/HSP70 family sugar kinase